MNKNVIFYKTLRSLIVDNVLAIKSQEIDDIYGSWEADKNKIGIKTNFTFSDNTIHEKQHIPASAELKGIDFPTWFGDYSKKRIVVLGIDPYRTENVFKREKANTGNEVIIGTPYALHELDSREGGCASYWTLVNGLSKNNFVYCTDIFKTYYFNRDKGVRSYDDTDYTMYSEHRELLLSELELIKPDLIIVLGKKAHELLLDIKSCPKIGQDFNRTKRNIVVDSKKIDVYTVMHLGNSYAHHMKVFLETNGLGNIDSGDKKACAEGYLKLFNNIINE